eukprot:GHVN01028369.1.p1 GENE.GHVN01028369.1~~GHVN01028369.1.p1  ORF type:complete len:224 (+),score=33.51 GHVN01028369.1:776-1447(+)
MGNSKSKTKGLTKGMPAVVDEGESRLISKKEALTSVETQLTQMKQMIDDLQHQLRKDELAARRFVAIKNNDLATLTLRKRAYHQRLINNLDKRVQRHENLDQQIRQNKVDCSISKALSKASQAINDAKVELSLDYLRHCRRPDFSITEASAQLNALGIHDDQVMPDLNALWMEELEDALEEDTMMLQRWDSEGGACASENGEVGGEVGEVGMPPLSSSVTEVH